MDTIRKRIIVWGITAIVASIIINHIILGL